MPDLEKINDKTHQGDGMPPLGHRLIMSMDDLNETVHKEIAPAYQEDPFETFWIDTNGRRMATALRHGNLKGMPFYCGQNVQSAREAAVSCDKGYFEAVRDLKPWDVEPCDMQARYSVYPTAPGEPFAEEYEWDLRASANCMYRPLLEATGVLQTEYVEGSSAPNCLLLGDTRYPLLLPVPIGFTLTWAVGVDFLDIGTYHLFAHRVSGNMEYADMMQDFDLNMLCMEAVATEQYITSLLDRAGEAENSRIGNLKQPYDDYCTQIEGIRKQYGYVRTEASEKQ